MSGVTPTLSATLYRLIFYFPKTSDFRKNRVISVAIEKNRFVVPVKMIDLKRDANDGNLSKYKKMNCFHRKSVGFLWDRLSNITASFKVLKSKSCWVLSLRVKSSTLRHHLGKNRFLKFIIIGATRVAESTPLKRLRKADTPLTIIFGARRFEFRSRSFPWVFLIEFWNKAFVLRIYHRVCCFRFAFCGYREKDRHKTNNDVTRDTIA